MKLLFTQDTLGNAGAERSHLELLARFSEDLDVSFVYFYPKHELKEAYEKAGIRLIFLDIPESYHFPLAVSRLVKLIRSEKPDLLVSSLWRADQITRIASWITGVPLVGTLVNDSYSHLAWKDKKRLKHKIIYWLDRLTAGIPIHWIANAQALAESHIRTLGLKREKISVVYRGRSIPVSRWLSGASEERAKQSVEGSGKKITDRFVPRDDDTDRFVPPDDDPHVIASEERAKQSVEGSGKQLTDRFVPRDDDTDRFVPRDDDTDRFVPRDDDSDCFVPRDDDTDRFVPRDDDTHVIASEERAKQSVEGSGKQLTDRFVPRDDDTHVSRWPSRDVTIRFLSYGRLLERKGFQDAIWAFSELVKTYPNCRYTIYGEGPYRSQLESLIQDLNLHERVKLPGKVSNPTALLLTADCFLFPSWYEGFSGALVEAMMAGIPIIASDIAMNLEAIRDQESALVFPVGNREKLAAQMIFALENPKRMAEFGAAARVEAMERFDIEKIAREYEGVLSVIARK